MGFLGFNKLSIMQTQQLEQEVTMEEVKQMIWSCDGTKVPGLDCFTFIFYKNAWHLIGPNIFYMVLEFSGLRKLPTGINISHMAFVPKSKLSTEFSE